MTGRSSFRSRLVRWYTVSLLVILLLCGIVMNTMIRHHLYAEQDSELEEEAQEVTEQLLHRSPEIPSIFDRMFTEHRRFSFQLENPDGSIISSSPWLRAHRLPRFDWDRAQIQTTVSNVSFGNLGTHRVLNRVVISPSGPLLVRVLAANERVEENIQKFTRIMLLAGTLALLAAFCGGYVITGQTMKPLEQIISDAERISAENFTELVTVQNPNDELGRLAITLNRTFSRLRKSLQQMSRFTADAAHELRTPLAALRLECDVALAGSPDLPTLKKSMELALEEIDRLSHIVNQLLSLSRLDSGVESQNIDSVFLRPLMTDVAELLEKSARMKGINFILETLPDSVIQGDDVALSRLFFNLIDNAIKYTPVGGRVTIGGREFADRVEVSIADTGIGIEQKDIEHLFDRFYRVDCSRNAMTGGAGLGLAICKAIADAHHAKLDVMSSVGSGSTFTVTFPLFDVPDLHESAGENANELQNTTAV